MDITPNTFGYPFGSRWMLRDIDELHDRMSQMMDMMVSHPHSISEVPSGAIAAAEKYPLAVDVRETENEYILKADVPGIPKEEIKIQVMEDGTVCLSGERKMEKTEEKEGYYKSERSYGKFSRTFKLPNINTEEVKAKYDNGELMLTAPKKPKPEQAVREVALE
eukprot:TRINITY_DN7592_c0_g1_i1.p2 TRINITY_DN7592_c0_g1~~TRINITY_DN7592_c0_g1_i1.p2  ORF type:complete len:164 (-),score=41.71 TRINITY_DN7592_c0_g1_i1:262-753(-)